MSRGFAFSFETTGETENVLKPMLVSGAVCAGPSGSASASAITTSSSTLSCGSGSSANTSTGVVTGVYAKKQTNIPKRKA